MGSYSLGFLSTGGIFLVILLIIRAMEPKLEAKFMNVTIKRILAKWDDEDDEEEQPIVKPNMEEVKQDVNQEGPIENDHRQQ